MERLPVDIRFPRQTSPRLEHPQHQSQSVPFQPSTVPNAHENNTAVLGGTTSAAPYPPYMASALPVIPATPPFNAMSSSAVLTPVDQVETGDVGPEVFEAFAYAQPIATNIPSAFDPAWTTGHYGNEL